VLGLSNKLEGKLAHTFNETVTLHTSGQLVSRVIIQDGHVGLPPEIMVLAPRIDSKITEPEGRHAIIDTDAYCENREKFNIEKIGSKLIELHDEIEKSFKATVTTFAINAWN